MEREDLIDLGVASVETKGDGHLVGDDIVKQDRAGLSDD
jgi:hypothetical protein